MSFRQRAHLSVLLCLRAAARRAATMLTRRVAGSRRAAYEALEHRTFMAAHPGSSMAYDAAGTLHVAYFDDVARTLKYMKQSPAGAWSEAVTVDSSSSDVGRMPSLALDAAGRPGVAYFDAVGEDLRFAYHDGSAWTTVAVETRDSVGQNPSLAFDAEGKAVVSYYRKTTGDLRLARLKNLDRNKWDVSTIAHKGDVGLFSTVAIDPATGTPLVAYGNATQRVRLLPVGGEPITVARSGGDVTNLSLGFSKDGRPVVSYYEPASGEVKLVESKDTGGRFDAPVMVAKVPAQSDAHPALVIDPATGTPQVVYYDSLVNGLFLARKPVDASEVVRTQVKSGSSEGTITAIHPGNGSISFATVDGASGLIDLGNTEATPLPPTEVDAIADGPAQVTVRWLDNAGNETGFLVERRTDNSDWQSIARLSPDTQEFVDTTVSEATVYRYRVSATGGIGDVAVGSTAPKVFGRPGGSGTGVGRHVTVVTPPNSPGDLVATIVSAERIDLSWSDRSSGETRYSVLSSTDGVEWNAAAPGALNLPADTTTLSVTGLKEGTTYLFSVYAEKGGQRSAVVPAVEATTLPAAPTDVTVEQISTSQLNVSWTNRAASADHVVLERSINGTAWTTVAVLPPATSTYNVNGLTEGTAYYFRVKAVGSQDSAYSSETNGTTHPLAPSNLAATAVSPTRIDLTWSDNAASETGYQVQRAGADGMFVTRATVGENTTFYADTSVVEGSVYTYRVRAAIGSGARSANSASVTLQPLPSSPTDLSASLTGDGRAVSLQWTDRATGETAYEVQRQVAGTLTWEVIATVGADVAAYLDDTAAEGAAYGYRVRAMNGGGASGFSGTASATTVPAKPDSLTAEAGSNTAIDLSWVDNSDGETGYRVERSTDGTTFVTIATTDANVAVYRDDGLESATTYMYRVSAVNAGGSSGATASVAATTRTDAPVSLTAVAVSDRQIDLAWAAVDGADGYRVERSTDGATWQPLGSSPTAAYSDLAVTEATAYQYRVRGDNAGGLSQPSDSVTAVSRPATPGDPVASLVGPAVNLVWTDVSGGETGYVVERSADGGATFSTAVILAPGVEAYTDTTVVEATSYAYRVRATGTGGPSAESAVAAIVTRPAAATDVVATTVSATHLSVTWSDNSAGEAGYRIERSSDGGTTWVVVATPEIDAQTYVDSELAPATAYAYRVVATSPQGDSEVSATATAITLTLPPTAVTATTVSTERIDLTWTDPVGADEIGVYRSVDGMSWLRIATVPAGVGTYVDSGLNEATDFYYDLVGVNAAGESEAAGTSTATCPIAPEALTATPLTATSVRVGWSDLSAGEEGFYLEISYDGGTTYAPAGATSADVETLDVTVTEGASVTFRVRGIRSGVYSDYSPAITVDLLPAAPSAATVESTSASSLTVNWIDNSTNETGFRVERSIDGENFLEVDTTSPNATQYVDTGLEEGTTYTYRVRATIGTSRNSDYTEAVTGTTRPIAPVSLTATLVADGVRLTWSNLSLNVDSYQVYRSGDGGTTWDELVSVESPTYTDATVQSGLTYLYRVAAVNEGGASAFSAAVMAPVIP